MVLSTRTHTMNGLLDEILHVYQWWRGSWRAGKAESILACSCALQRLVVSYGCSWLIHWMNCWQNSLEKKVMDMFQGSSWTVSIGTVIRAPHIKSISLDHRTFPRVSGATIENPTLRSSGRLRKWLGRLLKVWAKWYASGKPGISAPCGIELAKPDVVQLDPYC